MHAFAVRELSRLMDKSTALSLSLEEIVMSMPDFDADVIQPCCDADCDDEEFEEALAETAPEVKYTPYSDGETFTKYHRRLEDVHPGYLEKYLSEALYAATRYRDGIVRKMERSASAQYTLVDMEDGNAISESDLELDVSEHAWSQHEISNATRNLPYVMKRLYNLSILFHVHMLSFIASYKAADEFCRARREIGYTKTAKVNDVVAYGVYLCDDFGNPTYMPAVSAKNLRIIRAFRWYTKETDEYPAYHVDVDNFLHYLDVLNIDILHDDMSKYDAKYMASLIVTTVTPASQYDPDVYKALIGESKNEQDVAYSDLDLTLSIFRELCTTVPALKARAMQVTGVREKKNRLEMAMLLAAAYYQTRGASTQSSLYKFEDGYLTYNGSICVIGTSVFMDTPQVEECFSCVISELGLILGLSNSVAVHGAYLEDAFNNYNYSLCGLPKSQLPWVIWSD